MLNIPPTAVQFDYIQLQGGLDLVSPTLQIKPGIARDGINWEQSITGGYARIDGYERFSGKPNPSAANYLTLTLQITGSIEAGDTITGVTSGATGVVTSVLEGLVAYTKSVGTFLQGETINVSGSPEAIVTELGGIGNSADWDAQQRYLASNVYRADIAVVPGSGPVRGVAYFNGVTYAFRNNSGGTALGVYKSSGAGWVSVPMLYEIPFNTGVTQFLDGSTLTQGGVTATVRRTVLQDGEWGTNAQGRMLITAPAGGSFSAGAVTGSGNVTLTGGATLIALSPGGRVETDVGNFGPGPRLYGCDGVNRAWEFDGTYLMPINNGIGTDNPNHILVHQGYLWLSYGSSLENSGIGNPFDWTATGGASQFNMEETVTALLRQPGDQSSGTMYVGLAHSTKMVYGFAPELNIVSFVDSAGAKPYTAKRLAGQTYVLDDGGVFSLSASQNYGNFSPASITMAIRPWTQERRNLATAALINREKSQYRVFYSDGFGLYVTVMNGKLIGAMPVLFPDEVMCACEGETPDGIETAFFGSDNGFVYRLGAGTSFDGAPIDHYLTLTFASQKNSRSRKRYRKASIEVQGSSFAQFELTYELGYGSDDPAQGFEPKQTALGLSVAYWDSFTWDQFTWDGRTLSPTDLELTGTAENIALRFAGGSPIFQPFTLNSVMLHYQPRRVMR